MKLPILLSYTKKNVLSVIRNRKIKQVLSRVGYHGVGGHRVKEDKYGQCILCSCMKIEK
jgi:hypothetical protein